MKESDLQDKYLINFLCRRSDGLQYNETKANKVSPNFFVLEDLQYFLSQTQLNKINYRKLLRKFASEKELLKSFTEFLEERVSASMNMAIFINTNQSVTFEGEKLYLFYPSGTETYGDTLFDQNIFSVVQELPYTFKHRGNQLFSFRPDLTFFINGIYLGYSELKSNYNNQNARKNGRKKVAKDYLSAVQEYLRVAGENDQNQSIRKRFLKIFEKAIHITATDIGETFIIRTIASQFNQIRDTVHKNSYDFESYEKKVFKDFKPYPLREKDATMRARFEEIFKALYDKKMIEKEILYYNFIERELIKKDRSKTKEYKHNGGRLIAPRPKQKFGTDRVISKIDEFLEHEDEPNYFLNKLERDLRARGLGEKQIEKLVHKRSKYQNNKNVYSLLLQYAAGFGKSNIIGWTALQLKDLRRNDTYVYDKIMLVVDRLQLRDQLDSKMHNMNIQKGMFIEASDKKSFIKALTSDKRIVVVNVQKFSTINDDILGISIAQKLSKLRIAFLIDEIHRSQSGEQHSKMVNVFEELQSSFDNSKTYKEKATKKNLIVGFTATPSDHTLARFGEFNKYAEAEKIWIPFDSYTMKEAIKDGYILNPIKGIVPVSAKMYFETPENALKGFENEHAKKYPIRKKNIYENTERIKAISEFVAQRLVKVVYPNIRGTAKAMLAASSILAAINYKGFIKSYFEKLVTEKKYVRFKDAPIYVVYSEGQEHQSSSIINDGLSERSVLQKFKLAKNGLMIVVDKLQTGFDEPKLHTLFLDKEIGDINAIQTISRVNRTAKHKNDCKIIDFSHRNVNIEKIKTAFERFSNVVVSDFDPLGNEARLQVFYDELKAHQIYSAHFKSFKDCQDRNDDTPAILNIQEALETFMNTNPNQAKHLKKKIDSYFKILNLIEFVIELDPLYSDSIFLEFWRKYNSIYNRINKSDDIIDNVEIYFDNKIGIVAPGEDRDKPKKLKNPTDSDQPNKYKYDILKVIEKRNQQEEAIAELIKDFEDKIESFFEHIKSDSNGKRLVAKITDDGSAFTREEIYSDFEILYRKYTITNKNLGDFFKTQTKDILNQLCDDFEKSLTTR